MHLWKQGQNTYTKLPRVKANRGHRHTKHQLSNASLTYMPNENARTMLTHYRYRKSGRKQCACAEVSACDPPYWNEIRGTYMHTSCRVCTDKGHRIIPVDFVLLTI